MASITKIETKSGTRWRLRVYIGRDLETGKRSYVTRTYDRKKDARAEANRLERQKDLGAIVTPSKEPLGKYLKRWLKEVMKGRIRDRTFSDYEGVLRRYILDPPEDAPLIGRIRLDRLAPESIQGLYGFLQGHEALSPRRQYALCTQSSVRGLPTRLARGRWPETSPIWSCCRRCSAGRSRR